MDEKIYWLGFSSCTGIGPVKFQQLLTYFGTAENAWKATERELIKSGIGPSFVALIVSFRKTFSPAAYYERMQNQNVEFLIRAEENYPELLKKIKNPPFVLYVKGNKELLKQSNKNYIAVVGTRRVTEYGKQVTEFLTESLAMAGCVIVSGLALGVDAVAHKATLRAKGETIAVLGCGVACCYPRENLSIYSLILEHNGTIVSEYPLGMQPNKGSFPSRNRIIAGLSLGVLVTEGAEDSGSLITANDAFANNRKVFAVPGPITSSVSRGPIALINKGAKKVTSAQDILGELGLRESKHANASHSVKGDTKEEQKVIDLLVNQSLHFDELVKRTGLPSSSLGTLLSLMEMKGMVRSLESGEFSLAT